MSFFILSIYDPKSTLDQFDPSYESSSSSSSLGLGADFDGVLLAGATLGGVELALAAVTGCPILAIFSGVELFTAVEITVFNIGAPTSDVARIGTCCFRK